MIYTVSKKTLLLGSLLLSSLIFAGCSTKPVEQQPIQPTPVVQNTTTQPTPSPKPTPTPTPAPTSPSYTLQDVQSHNKMSDCWTTINSKVYNLTSAFGKHPGGDTLLASLCGIEGTAKFNGQHGASNTAKAMLNPLKIGTLK